MIKHIFWAYLHDLREVIIISNDNTSLDALGFSDSDSSKDSHDYLSEDSSDDLINFLSGCDPQWQLPKQTQKEEPKPLDVPMQTEEEEPMPIYIPRQTEEEDLMPLDIALKAVSLLCEKGSMDKVNDLVDEICGFWLRMDLDTFTSGSMGSSAARIFLMLLVYVYAAKVSALRINTAYILKATIGRSMISTSGEALISSGFMMKFVQEHVVLGLRAPKAEVGCSGSGRKRNS
ncbi:hypothetical protein Tco_1429360 [Tanacetum coccineum]